MEQGRQGHRFSRVSENNISRFISATVQDGIVAGIDQGSN